MRMVSSSSPLALSMLKGIFCTFFYILFFGTCRSVTSASRLLFNVQVVDSLITVSSVLCCNFLLMYELNGQTVKLQFISQLSCHNVGVYCLYMRHRKKIRNNERSGTEVKPKIQQRALRDPKDSRNKDSKNILIRNLS